MTGHIGGSEGRETADVTHVVTDVWCSGQLADPAVTLAVAA